MVYLGTLVNESDIEEILFCFFMVYGLIIGTIVVITLLFVAFAIWLFFFRGVGRNDP